jgi:nucleotide-binding universal stress UspA family protein
MGQAVKKKKVKSGVSRSLGGRSRWHLKIILAPVELSACSRVSLRYASAFAAKVGAKLIVLHVREVRINGSWAVDLARTLMSLSEHTAIEFENLLRAELPSALRSTGILLDGAPTHRIIETAIQRKVDLIIVTSHCRTGLDRARFGSVTEHLLRTAPCPVLVLPMRYPEDLQTSSLTSVHPGTQ